MALLASDCGVAGLPKKPKRPRAVSIIIAFIRSSLVDNGSLIGDPRTDADPGWVWNWRGLDEQGFVAEIKGRTFAVGHGLSSSQGQPARLQKAEGGIL